MCVRQQVWFTVLVPGESAQNIAEVPTVPWQVICSGDGTCGIESSVAAEYVHRCTPLRQRVHRKTCEEDSDSMLRPLCQQ